MVLEETEWDWDSSPMRGSPRDVPVLVDGLSWRNVERAPGNDHLGDFFV